MIQTTELTIDSCHSWRVNWTAMEYFEFARHYADRVKLLGRHYSTPGFVSEEYERQLQMYVINKFIRPVTAYYSTRKHLSPRIVFKDKRGLNIECRRALSKKVFKRFPFCLDCKNYNLCIRSNCLIPTSVKVTPEGRVVFCSVKEFPYVDLSELLKDDAEVSELSDYLYHTCRGYKSPFKLHMRVILTDACNLKCFFCHREGYKRRAA